MPVTLGFARAVSVVAEPGAIVRLAVRAENAADELHRERARLGSEAGRLPWRSTAASSFAARARGGADMLQRDAHRLEELAVELRRHASHVEARLQVLADLKSTVHAAKQAERAERWTESHAPW
jgi:hypothetical protein